MTAHTPLTQHNVHDNSQQTLPPRGGGGSATIVSQSHDRLWHLAVHATPKCPWAIVVSAVNVTSMMATMQ
jgi:hypothetical protein